jgi:ABC-type sulfate transport system permease component
MKLSIHVDNINITINQTTIQNPYLVRAKHPMQKALSRLEIYFASIILEKFQVILRIVLSQFQNLSIFEWFEKK